MNSRLITDRVLDYLDALERALQLAPQQARRIVDEVRADLVDQIRRRVEQGRSEPEAVDAALDDLGPPAELARRIRDEAAPEGDAVLRAARYALGLALVGFAGWVLWHGRAWTYGFSPIRALGIAACCLPILLMVWPGVIWRRNWMFSAIPTGVVLAIVAVLAGGGRSATATIDPAVPPSAPLPASAVGGYVALALLSAVTVFLLVMMQRPRQRVIAIAVGVLLVVAVELPYALEEQRYAARLDDAKAILNDYRSEHGRLPTVEAASATPMAELGFTYTLLEGGEHYSLLWDRPLNPGYALGYSSDQDRMWVND